MFKKLKSHLYVLQLLEYDPDRFVVWVVRNFGFFPKEKKGRLGWSSKARLVFGGSILIQLIISTVVGFILLQKQTPPISYILGFAVFLTINLIFSFFPSITLILSLFFFQPFELAWKQYLFYKASVILKNNKGLIIIGVTGSFGKTSVKHFLYQMLNNKFQTAATPESYNKKMSIAQTIINLIKPETQIFIVEMGAYKIGEIRDICQLVKPGIGILTGITNQHLERFGSLENIKKSKNELIQSLPKDGFGLFNLDSPPVKELYDQCVIKKEDYSLSETKIEIKSGVSNFNLFGNNVKTSILGKHNVLNILAAVKVARHLGLSENEITERVEHIQPAPHRLELIRGENQSLIIDDGYSANLEGFYAALDLVQNYHNYPKVLVTPGIVELGKRQTEENLRLAQSASKFFDYVIIVNLENRKALESGFLSRSWLLYNSYQEEKPEKWQVAYEGIKKDKIIFVARDLNEATQEIFPKISRSSSLILLENDLPDIYR